MAAKSEGRTLTQMLREEVAHHRLEERADRLVQATAMIQFGGRWHRRTQGSELVVRCAYGAVMRRLRQTLVEDLGSRPDITRYVGTNLAHSGGWLVRVAPQALNTLGLPADPPADESSPVWTPIDIPAGTLTSPNTSRAWVRVGGAIMVGGSLNAPHAPVHFELGAPDAYLTQALSDQMGWPKAVDGRIVIKKSSLVEGMLTQLGAVQTLGVFREGRAYLAQRKQANRTANADQANLARITAAAEKQIRAIGFVVEMSGWEGFPEDLRPLALVRYANPEASLAELGSLLVPPVDKATVHRRLKRILNLALSVEEESN